MEDEKINHHFAVLSEQFIALASQVAELRAAVNVLKVCVATQASSGQSDRWCKSSPAVGGTAVKTRSTSARDEEGTPNMIEALKQWKSGGKHSA